MNQPVQTIEPDAFFASLRNRTANGVYSIAFDGSELPVSVHLRESSRVVFTFSGAVDREKHALPRFAATNLSRHVPATIVALADPSLSRSDSLKLAWYAGHEGFELQKTLPAFLWQVIDTLDATRIAFVGTSAGGFAALSYAWHVPGSIALVTNPQTNIGHAIPSHRESYRSACWPGLPESEATDTVITTDLGSLYATRCENTVIYLQQASDFFHLKWHFAPFVSRLPREFADQLIVRMANWGERGHQPVPARIWLPWLNAALSASNTTAASIEATWAAANEVSTSTRDALRAVELPDRAFERDEQIAARLARAANRSLLGPPSSPEGRP